MPERILICLSSTRLNPVTGAPLRLEAPLPPELEAVLARLRKA